MSGWRIWTALSELDPCQLNLRDIQELENVSPLAGCASLSDLDLGGTGVSDLRPLIGLRRLEYLSLDHCLRVEDLSPLAGLGGLRHLWLSGVAPGLDLAPLAGNKGLSVSIRAGQDVRNGHLLGRRLKRTEY
jgi:Leucine-rich repeat (LRR) protein